MADKMSKAPVYLVLAQVQFNAVLALDKYMPTIQESFRKLGFPDFRKALTQTFNLNVGEAQVVPVSPSAQFIFSDIEKRHAFVLNENALTYYVAEYDVFETFSNQLLQGLRIVEAAVGGLSFTDRVGVRYLDAIYPSERNELSSYLAPSTTALFGKIGGAFAHSFSETAARINEVTIVSRVIIHSGPVGVSADLQPLPVEIPDRFKNLNGLHASLDNDGSIQVRAKYDLEKLKNQLQSIHHEVDKAFKLTVTEHALQEWK